MANLNDAEVSKLITLYEEQENLYNFNLPSYHDRDKAKESFHYISVMIGKGWDVATIKAKLKWLRNGYTRNAASVKSSQKSGASRDDVIKVRWRWFKDLEFLKPFCKLTTKGISNLPLSPTQESQLDESQLMDSQMDMETREDILDEEILQDTEILSNTADSDIRVMINRSRQEVEGTGPTPSTSASSSSATSLAKPSTPVAGPVRPPELARLDRKRKASGDTGPLYSLMANIAGTMKHNAESRKEPGNGNGNVSSNFCRYLDTELKNLRPDTQR